jgi:ribonuclease-3
MDLAGMISTVTNYKSKIIEWSQKETKVIEYRVLKVNGNQRFKEFVVELCVDGEPVAEGKGGTKKKAEQEASKNACEILNIAV